MPQMGYTAHYAHAGSSSSPPEAAVAAAAGGGGQLDITFTATTSASGTLLVGSSREFSGFGREGEGEVVGAIMQRAAHFLPALAGVQRQDISVRSGPRPWAAVSRGAVGAGSDCWRACCLWVEAKAGCSCQDMLACASPSHAHICPPHVPPLHPQAGTPWVGPVPGVDGLLLAAGHEGSGLTLAPASAALLVQHLLGEPAHLEGDVVDHLAVPPAMEPILAE